ncbi:MAG: GDYXXLXY domain-containing protein [Actinomycetota bacterium]|nr:GDYXXLXY domain-containing protein [Actinomycetota bacterium]
MNIFASRTRRVVVASLVQLALLPIAVAGPLSARLTGEEYLLEVAPVDPIDPFRGAYVALSYPGLPNDQDRTEREDDGSDTAYIPLVRSGEVWVGLPVVAQRPESGPFLRCKDEHWRLRCGIDSFFLAQDQAYKMEQAVREGEAVAKVLIDSRGNAALVEVDIRGGE